MKIFIPLLMAGLLASTAIAAQPTQPTEPVMITHEGIDLLFRVNDKKSDICKNSQCHAEFEVIQVWVYRTDQYIAQLRKDVSAGIITEDTAHTEIAVIVVDLNIWIDRIAEKYKH